MQLKDLLKVSCFILFCMFALAAKAQNVTVTGKVTDAKDGSPLPGVTVTARGTTIGTVTDANGNFRLSVPSAIKTLTISFLGYNKKEVAITGEPLRVSLESSSTALSDVVVVGYGTVRKKDLTGAVAKITSTDFVQGVTTDPLQQLQGKAAGVVITTATGDPTSPATVRIRGTGSLSGGNDPLYVIDGVVGADIHSVSPNDIESFDIMKDASAAAIYGSRAAGGVISVTTKTGKAGKTQVSFNSYIASESPEHFVSFMNRSQYLAAYQGYYNKAMPTGTSTTSDQGANTDWFKEITRTGFTHNENLAISGGTDKSHYRASVTYIDQQGIALTSEVKNLNARFNYDQKTLDDKLTITMNFSGSHINANYVDSSAFLFAASVPPVLSLRDPAGSGQYQYINNTQETNPVPHLAYVTNTGVVDHMLGNLKLDYVPVQGLTISPYVNGSLGRSNTNLYLPPSTLLSGLIDRQGAALVDQGDGDVDKGSTSTSILTYGATANYKNTFGKSRLNVLVGTEGNQFNYTGFRVMTHSFNGINLPNENIGAGNIVAAGKDINSYDYGYKLYSYFGRADYSYNDKYYITGNIRYDWSQKLGLNNQSGVFPSANAAWNISSEDFMKDIRWISTLKLRGGWGEVGNQDAISPLNSQALLGSSSPYFDLSTNSWLASNFLTQNPNADLRWEVRSTTDIGADFSLFNGRLNGSVDYYDSRTNHLLYTYTVPTGGKFFVSTILANVGSLSNKGWEFALNAPIVRGKDFSWTAGANMSINRNKIINLSGNFAGTTFNVTQTNVGTTSGLGISGAISQVGYLKVGFPVGTLLLPGYAGQDANGKQLFWKYNADGTRTAVSDVSLLNYADNGSTKDRMYYTTDPKFTYGFTSNFNYKDLTLTLFLRGQYGSHGFNETYMDYTSLTKLGTYGVLTDAAKYHITSSSEPSTFWLQGTSFLKVQNVTLGYNLKIHENRYIDKLYIYVAGNNLYTFTSYKGLDPELSTNVTGGEAGIDVRTLYPRARELSFGVNLNLK